MKGARRNWREYNEKLVRRGEILLDLDFLRSWNNELEEMNKGKVGRPYEYPMSYLRFLSMIYYLFQLPYRQLEGFTRALSSYGRVRPIDHSTIHERLMKLDLGINAEMDGDLIIAVDASGIKVTNRGEWIREQWKKRRGYVKIHFAVDITTKNIVSFEVTDESVGDNRKFKELVEHAGEWGKVRRVLADGAYDTRDDFDCLEEKGIEPGIKVRKDSSPRARGSPARQKAVLEFKELGYAGWKAKKGYGQRWIAETVFSGLKGMFGEFARAKAFGNMIKEIGLKVFVFNTMMRV